MLFFRLRIRGIGVRIVLLSFSTGLILLCVILIILHSRFCVMKNSGWHLSEGSSYLLQFAFMVLLNVPVERNWFICELLDFEFSDSYYEI